MRTIYTVGLGCLIVLVLGCDNGKYYETADEVNVVVFIERQVKSDRNASLKVWALGVEERNNGKTLIFECPCILGDDITGVSNSSVMKVTGDTLELEVLPNARYNIGVVNVNTGYREEIETVR